MNDRMTEQEAIKMMRYRIDTVTEIAGKGEDGNAFEDMEMAIKALEKQIPIKVEKSGYAFICPICKNLLQSPQEFCHSCGKKIKWH